MILWLAVACRTGVAPAGPVALSEAPWLDARAEIVREDGTLDEDALQRHRAILAAEIARLRGPNVRIATNRSEVHAFWLNTWNTLVYHRLAAGIAVDAIADDDTPYDIAGEWTTLDEIRNERLRMKEMDFRDHAAMFLGTADGPPAHDVRFRGAELGAQLDDVTRTWLAHPQRGVRVIGSTLELPPLFETHRTDLDQFTAGDSPCVFVQRHVRGPLRAAVLGVASEGCSTRIRRPR